MADQPDPSTRQRLLDATLNVIEEHGVDAVKVVDIAERADATTGSLYWFFKNRQALVNAALAQRYIRHMRQRLDAIKGDVNRILREGVDPGEPERVQARRQQIRVLADALDDPSLATDVAAIQREFLGQATTLIEGFQQQGVARSDLDAYSIALYIQAMAIGLAVVDLAPDLMPDPEKWWLVNQTFARAMLEQPPSDPS